MSKRSATVAVWFFVWASLALAQNETPQSSAPMTVLHTSTRLIVVDVSVRDSAGRPVHGLSRDAFRVEEDKTAQRIRSFDEHSFAEANRAGPPVPKLPPGSFTNYTPVPPNSTLNVLLVDALNTPVRDQTYLREQLLHFVEHAQPGQNIAIFGLSSKLYLLQGFTQDSAVLKLAVKGRMGRTGSSLLDDAAGTGVDAIKASDAMAEIPGTDDAVASLQQFESDTQAQQQQLRAQYTLDAMNALGHYLQNFSGRKNLIWFSGSFPINILPDPNVTNGFHGLQINAEELHAVTDLLARAQVAVYPVDPRGVQTQPVFDAANSGRRYAGAPQNVTKDIASFNAEQAAAHTTMEQMAKDTGGQAFYNTNDLASAVGSAMHDGADYYTLTYAPTNREDDGSFRRIHVELTDPASVAGAQLSYRRGYYAVGSPNIESEHKTDVPTGSVSEDPATRAADAYSRIAMSFGSPAPEDVLFQVHVTPAEVKSGEGKKESPATMASDSKKESRAYGVDYAALPDAITFTTSAGARRAATIAFKINVFSRDGDLLNSVGKVLRLNLTPADYKKVMDAGIGLHLDVTAPIGVESFLRIGIQDVPSNRYGVVELSTKQIDASAGKPATH